MNATVSAEIVVPRAGTWVSPSQCPSVRQWIHHLRVDLCYWERTDCLVFVLRRRLFGFEFEVLDRRRIPSDLM